MKGIEHEKKNIHVFQVDKTIIFTVCDCPFLSLTAWNFWELYIPVHFYSTRIKNFMEPILLYPPYECTYRGYYGLVVVTPPRPQTYLCERDNFKKSWTDCFHILYVDWYRWEDSWEARWARSDYFWATQGPPNSQKCTFLYIVAHIRKTGSYVFPLLYICLLCDEVLLPWNFRSPGFDIRAPQDPQKWKKMFFFFIFWV